MLRKPGDEREEGGRRTKVSEEMSCIYHAKEAG